MIPRKERTVELYKHIGAEARLLKSIMARFEVDSSKILYAQDNDRFSRLRHGIDILVSRMEEQMFKDFPDLGNEYINVFYGDIGYESLHEEIDREIRETAQGIIDGIMDGK